WMTPSGIAGEDPGPKRLRRLDFQTPPLKHRRRGSTWVSSRMPHWRMRPRAPRIGTLPSHDHAVGIPEDDEWTPADGAVNVGSGPVSQTVVTRCREPGRNNERKTNPGERRLRTANLYQRSNPLLASTLRSGLRT